MAELSKMPEEIKKGLGCDVYSVVGCFLTKCNYRYGSCSPDSGAELRKDALALIQQLERDKAWASENYELIREENKRLEAQNIELLQKIKQLERERDALLTIMKGYRECDFCKHGCPPEKEEHLFDLCYGCDIENCRCRNCTTKNNCWEWRGPCEESGGN